METLVFSVSLVKIPVRDLSTASRFYREILGLKEDFVVSEFGWAQYTAGQIPLCIYEPGKGGGEGIPGGETGIHLSVKDAKEAHRQIKGRGECKVSDVVSSADGGLFFTVEDPDGNSIKIGQN